MDQVNSGVQKSFLRNILFMSCAFFGIFFAFSTSQGLQTSVDPLNGYIYLGTLYFFFTFFSIFGPKIVNNLGPKLSLCVGGATYAIVVAANFTENFSIRLVANMAVGIGAALLWNAEGVYLARCALHDSLHSNKPFAEMTSKFNGIFYGIFQFTGMVGTLISAVLLTFMSIKAVLGVNTVICVVAVIGMFFLPTVNAPDDTASLIQDKESNPEQIKEKKEEVSLVETLKLIRVSKQLQLIIPIMFFNGLSLAYFFGDVSAGLFKPFYSEKGVMYFAALFYGVNAIGSYVFGLTAGSKFGKSNTCCLAFILQVISLVALSILKMTKESAQSAGSIFLIALIVTLFSLGDSVWESQPPAILASMYTTDRERNAAMANVKMWQSLGWCLMFALSAKFNDPKFLYKKSFSLCAALIISYGCIVGLESCVQSLDAPPQAKPALVREAFPEVKPEII